MKRYRTNIEFECKDKDFPKICNELASMFEPEFSKILAFKTTHAIVDMPKEIKNES